MREVAIHFENEFVIALESPFEAGAVGASEAVFFGAVEDVDRGIFGGEFIGELAGAVGGIVIDDENIDGDGNLHDASDDVREILPLVVGRYYDDRIAHCAADR